MSHNRIQSQDRLLSDWNNHYLLSKTRALKNLCSKCVKAIHILLARCTSQIFGVFLKTYLLIEICAALEASRQEKGLNHEISYLSNIFKSCIFCIKDRKAFNGGIPKKCTIFTKLLRFFRAKHL